MGRGVRLWHTNCIIRSRSSGLYAGCYDPPKFQYPFTRPKSVTSHWLVSAATLVWEPQISHHWICLERQHVWGSCNFLPWWYFHTSQIIVARIVDWTNKIYSIQILNFYSLVNKTGFEIFVWCGQILLLGKVIVYLNLFKRVIYCCMQYM